MYNLPEMNAILRKVINSFYENYMVQLINLSESCKTGTIFEFDAE